MRIFIFIIFLAITVDIMAQKTGLGVPTPQARFHVHIPPAYSDSLLLLTKGNNIVWIITSSGNTGFGVISPQKTLHIGGRTRWESYGGNSAILLANDNGVVYKLSATGSTTDILNGSLSWFSAGSSTYLWQGFVNSGVTYIMPTTLNSGDTVLLSDSAHVFIKTNNGMPQLSVKGKIWQDGTSKSIWIGVGTGKYDNMANNMNVYVGDSTGFSNSSGQFNVGVGVGALRSNTTGSNNVAIGFSALYTNTSGNYNVAIGSGSLTRNTIGRENIAIGEFALSGCDSCVQNIVIGPSMKDSAGGRENIAIGAFVMNATTGERNVGVGYSALRELLSGSRNVAIGDSALASCQYCSEQVAVGSNALTSLIWGSNNVGVGSYTMLRLKQGDGNTAVGSQAMNFADTAFENIAFGSYALQNTEGYRNIGIGYSALSKGVSIQDNIAIGYNSMRSNLSSPRENIAIGNLSMDSITTGSNNIAIGHLTMNNITTGQRNIAIGTEALKSLTTGNANIAVGFQALRDLTVALLPMTAVGYMAMRRMTSNGAGNVAVGAYTLTSATGGVGITAIGYRSLASAKSSAHNNTAVGFRTMEGDTTGKENTAVGAFALAGFLSSNRNTAIGYKSLYTLKDGTGNVALGSNTATALTTGSYNVFIGANTADGITSSSGNVLINAVGLQASTIARTVMLKFVGAGGPGNVFQDLVFMGSSNGNLIRGTGLRYIGSVIIHGGSYYSGDTLDYATETVNIGYVSRNMKDSLYRTVNVGWANVFYSNPTYCNCRPHESQTVIGYGNFAPHSQSVLIGTEIMSSIYDQATPTTPTLVIGHDAESELWIGGSVVVGYKADGKGPNNTVIGSFAGKIPQSGKWTRDLVLIGSQTAQFHDTNLVYGTLIGYLSHVVINDGRQKYGFVGIGARTSLTNNSAPATILNSTAFGYQAVVTNPNTIALGDVSVTWNGGQVNWSTYSDRRFKKDIREDVVGLNFITKLRPVTYHIDLDQYCALLSMECSNHDSLIETIKWTGFIAQEVDSIAKATGFRHFSGVSRGKVMGLRYAEFVVPLTKAVQEQQVMIEETTTEINSVAKQIEYAQSILQNSEKQLNKIEKKLQEYDNY